ncbi:MAG: hypothetical protein U5N86_13860 [Planctomycetota bacterium]|nr:hypothetical protein [Planctomycetota bacterium]
MAKDGAPSKGLLVVGGVLIFLLFAALVFFLLQENPASVVHQFFEARSVKEKQMLLTPESSGILKRNLESYAMSSGMSLARIERQLDKTDTQLVEVHEATQQAEDSYVFTVSVRIVSQDKSSIDKGKIYVKKVGNSWKIDLTPPDALMVF